MSDRWPGCHGVRINPPASADGYGTSTGRPLANVHLARGPLAEPGVDLLWRLEAEVPIPGGSVMVDQRLWRDDDGAYVLRTARGAGLFVDVERSSIVITADSEAVERQLVTTIALPLVLHETGALTLHAAGAHNGDGAVIVCGASGAGKSSLLVGMVAAGWRAVSEDVCAVDLDGDVPTVFPGPPWVRRQHNEPGPNGSVALFQGPDKTAWDIGADLVDGPVPVALIVFLEPPGGDEVEWQRLTTPEAVGALAPHALWLADPLERAARTFGPCVRLVGSVPAARLRLPVGDSWLEGAVAALTSGAP